MDVRVGLWRRLITEELILLNCDVGEERVPRTARRSNQSILKEISPGISLEGMMLKLKLQYFGHFMQSWLIGKNSGRDWGQEEKGTTEDEMVRWYHWLDGHEFEQAPGDGDGQGSLVCCSPRGRKELDTTERLNWTELIENVGFPGGASGKEPAYQNKRQRRRGFNPWIGKIPWRRERLPTPVFWAGEFHGLYSPWGLKELNTTEWLSLTKSVQILPLLHTLSSIYL